MDSVDYYDILGLKRNAAVDDIRRAYRKLAIRYHPDKNKDDGSEEMFKKIAEAYEVLSDPEKRPIYDMYGLEGLKGNYQSEERHSYAGNANIFHHTDPFEIFRQFFGGRSPFGDRYGDPFADDPFFSQGLNSAGGHAMFGGSMFGGSVFGGNMFAGSMYSSGMMQDFVQNGGSGGGGYSESTSIQETIVNGRRVTRVEKIIHKPDGTVERNVTEHSDDGARQISHDNSGTAVREAINYHRSSRR